jgi:hypothetical protein
MSARGGFRELVDAPRRGEWRRQRRESADDRRTHGRRRPGIDHGRDRRREDRADHLRCLSLSEARAANAANLILDYLTEVFQDTSKPGATLGGEFALERDRRSARRFARRRRRQDQPRAEAWRPSIPTSAPKAKSVAPAPVAKPPRPAAADRSGLAGLPMAGGRRQGRTPPFLRPTPDPGRPYCAQRCSAFRSPSPIDLSGSPRCASSSI